MGESANEDSCSKPLSKSQESEGLKQQKQWDDEDNHMSSDIVRIPWWNMGELHWISLRCHQTWLAIGNPRIKHAVSSWKFHQWMGDFPARHAWIRDCKKKVEETNSGVSFFSWICKQQKKKNHVILTIDISWIPEQKLAHDSSNPWNFIEFLCPSNVRVVFKPWAGILS